MNNWKEHIYRGRVFLIKREGVHTKVRLVKPNEKRKRFLMLHHNDDNELYVIVRGLGNITLKEIESG